MIGAHHSQQGPRGWIIASLRWLAAATVLGLLIHFLPLTPLRAAIARVPASKFLAILTGYLLAHCLGVAKWQRVVNAAGAQLDFVTSAQCYAGGLFGTLFLPSIIGGDVIRLAVGLRQSPRPAAVLAGNVVDRFLDVTAQAGLVLLGLILLPGSLPEQFSANARKLLLVCSAIAAIALLSLILLWKPLLGGRSLRFRRRLARFRHAFRSVRRAPQILIFGWVLGVLIQGTFILLNALLAISCGLFLPFRVWLFAWPLAKIAALLPLTQGGMGIREAVLVALLLPFGAQSSLALASGLVWEGIIVAGGLLSGLTAFLLGKVENANES